MKRIVCTLTVLAMVMLTTRHGLKTQVSSNRATDP
jgi:hypothetical protein